jgi:hypothetical protein
MSAAWRARYTIWGWLSNPRVTTVRQRGSSHRGLAIGRSLGDAEIVATLLMQRGLMAHREGDYSTARLYLEDSVTVWQTSPDTRGVLTGIGSGLGPALSALGYLALDQGDWFCRKFRFLRQNLKTGCQKFNGLQTSKFPKKQICDRTRPLRPPGRSC